MEDCLAKPTSPKATMAIRWFEDIACVAVASHVRGWQGMSGLAGSILAAVGPEFTLAYIHMGCITSTKSLSSNREEFYARLRKYLARKLRQIIQATTGIAGQPQDQSLLPQDADLVFKLRSHTLTAATRVGGNNILPGYRVYNIANPSDVGIVRGFTSKGGEPMAVLDVVDAGDVVPHAVEWPVSRLARCDAGGPEPASQPLIPAGYEHNNIAPPPGPVLEHFRGPNGVAVLTPENFRLSFESPVKFSASGVVPPAQVEAAREFFQRNKHVIQATLGQMVSDRINGLGLRSDAAVFAHIPVQARQLAGDAAAGVALIMRRPDVAEMMAGAEFRFGSDGG